MALMSGADPAALRALGATMRGDSQHLEQIASSLQAAVQRGDSWRGTDADDFRTEWTARLQPAVTRVARALDEAADTLNRQAAEQEQASGSGAGGGTSGVPGSASREFGGPDGSPTPVSPEIRKAWEGMSDDERKRVLQRLADQYADRYGLDRIEISFKDLPDDNGNLMGYWSEGGWFGWGKEMALDTSDLADPSIMLDTVAHEMRHAAQHEMIRDYEGPWWMLWGRPEWNNPEVSAETVESWKRNFDDYKVAGGTSESWKAYLGQPVEVDARAAGTKGVEDITLDKLNELKKP